MTQDNASDGAGLEGPNLNQSFSTVIHQVSGNIPESSSFMTYLCFERLRIFAFSFDSPPVHSFVTFAGEIFRNLYQKTRDYNIVM